MSNEENVQTEIPLEVTVTEDPLGVLNISTNSHSALADRDIADQHPIEAIEGLRARLLEIQNPTGAKSVNGRGYAEYYKWLGGTPSTDKTGYFVSLVQGEDDNLYITPVSTTHPNIFGVTIPISSAAFVGNDEWVEKADATGYESSIDETYGLVCLEGAVKVRYATNAETFDISPGDWVKPTTDGRAEKTTVENGCYLVAGKGIDVDGYYVEINLSLSASDVKKISVDHAKESNHTLSADNYTENGNIKTEFDGIKDGTIIVGEARHSVSTDDYTASGTIKQKFDDIDLDINNIKDGTTVVAKATHSINADNYTEDGTIKTKFDELEQYVFGIENGDHPVSKASGDVYGKQIDRNYYYLHSIDDNDLRYISQDKEILPYTSFDIDTLCKPSQCGIYLIEWSMITNGLISGLPDDDVFPNSGATVKLIVEGAENQGFDETFPSVYQTLKMRADTKSQNANLLVYHRVVLGKGGANNSPIWSKWQRFVSAEECDGRYARLTSGPNKINGMYEFNIGTVLIWALASGESMESFLKPGTSINSFKIHIPEWAPFLINKGETNVAGEWITCGMTGMAKYSELDDNGEVSDYDKLVSYQLYMIQRVK